MGEDMGEDMVYIDEDAAYNNIGGGENCVIGAGYMHDDFPADDPWDLR